MVIPAGTDLALVLISILLVYSVAIPLRVGAFSLAPAAFCGFAAYVSGVASVEYGVPVGVAMVLGIAVVAAVAALLGVPLSRARGIHTALMTVSVVVVGTALESSLGVTGGSLGLSVPSVDLLVPLVVAVVLTVLGFRWLDHSTLGRRLAAVHADEDLARSLGFGIGGLRFGAFCASGALAAVAGVAYAHSLYYIAPVDFSFGFAVTLAIYVIVSGADHWLTPLVGTGVLALFTVATPNLGTWSVVIQGLVAAVIAVVYPRGLAGLVRRRLRYRSPRTAAVVPGRSAVAQGVRPADDTGGAGLRVESVGVVYGGVVALADVSFDVRGPGCLGVIGPNGSGKSTLIGVLSGLIRPATGTVTTTDASGEVRAGVRIARCFQQPKLVPNLRVWENVALGARGRATGGRGHALARGAEAGLTDAELNAWPSDISTGTQRKVELARALMAEPDVLLLDEPAAGLSSAELTGFVRVVEQAAESRLVVVVEHNLRVVYALAEEVVLLVGGRVAARGSAEEMRASPAVARAYLGASADVGPDATAADVGPDATAVDAGDAAAGGTPAGPATRADAPGRRPAADAADAEVAR